MKTLQKFNFFIIIFLIILAGCQKETFSSHLTREERKDLDYFFRYLLIRGSGAFVLFGSKPLCDTGYFNHVAARKNSPFLRDLSKGWDAWKKIRPQLNGKRFTLVKSVRKIQLTGYHYDGTKEYDYTLFTLIDTQKAACVLEENYEFFKELVGEDFNPHQVVRDAENPHSTFWKMLQQNSITYGLFYGFGKRNSELWTQKYKTKNLGTNCSSIWGPLIFQSSMENLLVPGYISFEGDEMLKRYKKEKEQIKKLYRGKNFLEITLRQFSS